MKELKIKLRYPLILWFIVIFIVLPLGLLFKSFVIHEIEDRSLNKQSNIDIHGKGDNLFFVIRAIDGDTIEIQGEKKIRYIGINTPELERPNKKIECFAKEALQKNKDLVEGKYVRLEKDVSETDKYQRLLRYVYVDGIFMNLELVKEGYAQVATYPPDIKYQKEFLQAQKEARAGRFGLWQGCKSN